MQKWSWFLSQLPRGIYENQEKVPQLQHRIESYLNKFELDCEKSDREHTGVLFHTIRSIGGCKHQHQSNAVTDVDADDDPVDAAARKKRSGSSSSSSSSSTAAAKRAKSDHCMWTGKLCEAKKHFNECEYAGALCGFGCGAVVRRIDMPEHEASICPNRGVMCTNVGCTALMPQPMIAAHKANDCLYELVNCPFSSVGFKERVLRKDVDSHEEVAMKQHNRLLLQDNRSLRNDIQVVRQENLSL